MNGVETVEIPELDLTQVDVTEYLNGLEAAARVYYKALPRKERRAEVRAALKRAKKAIKAARAAQDE